MESMKVQFEVEVVGLGAWLKSKRESAGLNTVDAAAKAGMTRTNLYLIEKEFNQKIPLSTLLKLTDAIGADLSEIVGDRFSYELKK